MWQHSRAERYKTLSTHIKKTMGGMPRIILTAAQSQQPAATSQDLLDCVIKTLKGARKARAARRRALLPRRTSVHCFLIMAWDVRSRWLRSPVSASAPMPRRRGPGSSGLP